MPVYDISRYKIRVILDVEYYNIPRPETPIDVEGTVLAIRPSSLDGDKYFHQGKILQLLCDCRWEDLCDVRVRWDSDVKSWLAGGTLALRSTELRRCRSIWHSKNKDILESTTPYHLLKPKTSINPAELFNTLTVPKLPKLIGNVMDIPRDGEEWRCIHEGKIGTAWYVFANNVIRFQHDLPGANEEIIHLPPSVEEVTHIELNGTTNGEFEMNWEVADTEFIAIHDQTIDDGEDIEF